MRITITSSILALALSSVCAQAVMAAPRPSAPSMSSPPVGNTTAPGSSTVGVGSAGGSAVMNPSGNSFINTSPSGSTMFPFNGTTGTAPQSGQSAR